MKTKNDKTNIVHSAVMHTILLRCIVCDDKLLTVTKTRSF